MTNFERFQKDLMERVSKELSERGIEDVSLKLGTINSPDGMTDRLMVTVGESKMSMAFRLKEVYSDFELGDDMNAIVNRVCNTIKDNIPVATSKGNTVKDFVTDYNQVKDYLYLRLIPGNSPALKDAPHKLIGDMAEVVSVQVPAMSDANGKSVVMISNPLMDLYGVDQEQLFSDAEMACTKKEPLKLVPLGDMIRHLIDLEELPDPADVGITTYIASNTSGFHGAGVVVYPDFFEKSVAELGGSFWMLPSSVHEFILIKDDGRQKASDLNRMIRDVNKNVLEPRDFLSDQCYHYDAIEKVLTTGLDYEKGVTKSLLVPELKTEDVDVDAEPDVDEGMDI